MKLWQKNTPTDEKIVHFTVGKDRVYDLHLAAYDCQASIAHVKMLGQIEILTEKETQALVGVLNEIKTEAENGKFLIEDSFEDMHSKIEFILTQKLGDLGKKYTQQDQETIKFGIHPPLFKGGNIRNQIADKMIFLNF